MIRSLKNILIGLKNIWRWRKVIYKDRDWDHWYIFEILKTKLKFQADHLRNQGITESAGTRAKEILECIDLIDKIQNEVYISEAIEGLDASNWTDEMFNDAVKKHDNARKQLFQLLEAKIESWWD